MAKLKSIFENGVETAFTLFEEAIISGTFYHITKSDGFDDDESDPYTVRVIANSLTQEDLQGTSFSDRIQPTDIVCIIPGSDFEDVVPTTKDTIYLGTRGDGISYDKTYSIVDFDVDPLSVMYTILLRNA